MIAENHTQGEVDEISSLHSSEPVPPAIECSKEKSISALAGNIAHRIKNLPKDHNPEDVLDLREHIQSSSIGLPTQQKLGYLLDKKLASFNPTSHSKHHQT